MKFAWQGWAVVGLVLMTATVGTSLTLGATSKTGSVNAAEWAVMTALLVLAALMISWSITGKGLGILIDQTNRVGVAHLQLLLWTFLFVGVFLAATTSNLIEANAPPGTSVGDRFLDAFPSVPGEVWVLLGISVTSLAGTPLLQNSKRSGPSGGWKPVDDGTAQLKDSTQQRLEAAAVSHVDGVLTRKGEPEVADLFRGEDTGSADTVDVSKIQMFYFTLLLVIGYGAASVGLIAAGGRIAGLPAMSDGFVALLGISQVGYLAKQGVPNPD